MVCNACTMLRYLALASVTEFRATLIDSRHAVNILYMYTIYIQYPYDMSNSERKNQAKHKLLNI